jgi:hypothetical protein
MRLPRGMHAVGEERLPDGSINLKIRVDKWRVLWEMLKLAPRIIIGETPAAIERCVERALARALAGRL